MVEAEHPNTAAEGCRRWVLSPGVLAGVCFGMKNTTSETSASCKGWAGRGQDCSTQPFGSSGTRCMVTALHSSSSVTAQTGCRWHRMMLGAYRGTAGGEEVQAAQLHSPLRSKSILTTEPPLTSHHQRQDNTCAAVPQHRAAWGTPLPWLPVPQGAGGFGLPLGPS